MSSSSVELKSSDSMSVSELKRELSDHKADFSKCVEKQELQALLREVRSRPTSSSSTAPAVPQQQKSSLSTSTNSTSSSSSSSSSAIIDFEKEEVLLTEQDFQVLKLFCYYCSRRFNLNDNAERERCRQKCGATFCDRDCFGKFLKEHGLEHTKLCKTTSTIRQSLKDVRSSRSAPSHTQCVVAVGEANKIIASLDDNNNNKLSRHDRLMVDLVLCEATIVFDFVDELCRMTSTNCATLLSELSFFDRALLFARCSLLAAKRESGEQSVIFAECLRNVAWMLSGLCRYDEAKQLLERSLTITESTIGRKTKQYATTLNYLGIVLKTTCKYDAAIEKYELSAKIHRALSGGESLDYADAVTSLAIVLFDSNHHETALVWQEIVLNIHRNLFGDDHERCAISHDNIGNTLLALKRYDEARSHIERAIRISERVYGTAHVNVAQSLTMLGSILLEQSRFDEALRLYERSLAIYQTTPHPGIGVLLRNMGNLHFRQERFDMALEKYREALSKCLESFGENHIHTAGVLQNIGQALLLRGGDFDGAIEHLQRSLTTFEKIFDLDDEHEARLASKQLLEEAKKQKHSQQCFDN